MPWFTIERRDGLLAAFPFNDASEKSLKRHEGEDVELTISGRSLPQFRLFHKYCRWAFRDTILGNGHATYDDFRDYLSVACGHYEPRIFEIPSGEGRMKVKFLKPKTWSPSRGTQAEFNEFVSRAQDYIAGITGVDIATFQRNAEQAEDEV